MAEGRNTKKLIVESAFTLLLRRGVPAVTLDRVAVQADVSKGSILYHFKTKDELIAAMVQHAISMCMEELANKAPSTRESRSDPWSFLVWSLVLMMTMPPKEQSESTITFAGLSHRFLDLSQGGVDVFTSLVGENFLHAAEKYTKQ